jgi:hypothetical protein
MKPSQSSVYRQLELLSLRSVRVGNRVPNDFGLREITSTMIREILDALRACALALQEKDMRSRLTLIDTLIYHLTLVKSTSKVLIEWSSQNGQTTRIISERQRQELLKAMTQIGYEIGRWRTKTAQSLD